jgi:hypothetical protein
MTWDEKRALIASVFSGRTLEDQRMGVYIHWVDNKRWMFSIRGHVQTIEMDPLPGATLDEIYDESNENIVTKKTLY